MANEIVCESRFATDQANERGELHVLFDDFEVFLADGLESEAVTHDDQDVVPPIRQTTVRHTFSVLADSSVLPDLVKVEADLTVHHLGGGYAPVGKLRCMGTLSRFTNAAPFLLDARQRNVPILEGADAEVSHWSVLLLQGFEDQTRCIDAVPLAWIDAKVFEAKLGHVLHRVRGHACPFVVVEQ